MGLGGQSCAQRGSPRCRERERKISQKSRRATQAGGLRDWAIALRIRKNDSRQIKISQLRAHRFSFGQYRRASRKIVAANQSMLERTPPQNFHAGAESLAQGRSRSAARHHAESPAGANLLHDASEDRSANLLDVHQPKKSAALQL